MSTRAVFFVLALLLAVAIFATSAMPTQVKFALHTQGPLHPWLHFLGFALLAFLLLGTTRSWALRLALVCALLLFGYGTEKRESKKDGWPIEAKDVRTDSAGVLLGSAVSLLLAAATRARRDDTSPQPRTLP